MCVWGGVVNFFVTNRFLCEGGGEGAGVENNSGEIDEGGWGVAEGVVKNLVLMWKCNPPPTHTHTPDE